MSRRNADSLDMESITETVGEISESWQEFRGDYAEVKSRLEKLEIQADAPPFTRNSDTDGRIKGLDHYLRTGDHSQIAQKAMTIGTDSSGGYMHVPELDNQVWSAVGELNPLMAEVDMVTIDANEYQRIYTTTRNATGRAAEGGTRSETTTPVFERVSIPLFTLYSYPKVSEEMMGSTGFDVQGWLRNDVAEAFSEALATEFVTGDGSSKSVGLLNSVSPNTLGGSPDLPWGSIHSRVNSPQAVSYANLLDVISALPLRYKANAKWYMSTTQIEAVRNLLDSNNLPIWRQDFGVAGAPMVLLGYPVVEVPQLESTSYEILFGDMKRAYSFVRHSSGLKISVDSNITTPGQWKFYIRQHCAGGVTDSRAMVALAC